jgi:two-component system sensor histidine kinase VicK
MNDHDKRLLLTENDLETCDLIVEQSLKPLCYHVDVSESAATVIQEMSNLSPDIIVTDLNLPPRPSMIKVYLSQTKKVTEGLLSNAIKYSPNNGEVTFHLEQDKDKTVLTVSDQGEGIDENLADRLFEANSGMFGYTPDVSVGSASV